MKVYKCLMSDGKKVEVRSANAGQAVMEALSMMPGRTVTRCYAGITEEDADAIRLMGGNAMVGTEDFDIPPHEPMTEEDAAKFGKRARRIDNTSAMFTESEMKGQA